MFTINISFKVEHSAVEDWKEWIKQKALPQIIQNTDAENWQLHALLGHGDEHGETFVVQFLITDKDRLNNYLQNYQQRLHAAIRGEWGDKVLFFETVLQKLV